MFQFTEDHLRVLKPITTDGQNLLLRNGQVQYKVVHFPKSARKDLEKRNIKLPDNLKLQITDVKAYQPTPIPVGPDPLIADMQRKIEELEAANKKLADEKTLTKSTQKQPAHENA